MGPEVKEITPSRAAQKRDRKKFRVASLGGVQAAVLVRPARRGAVVSLSTARRVGMTDKEWLAKRLAGLSNGARRRWVAPSL